MNKTWAGNTYYNVNKDTKPVYSGSSSGGHVVKTNNSSGGGSKGSSGGGGKKSSGSKSNSAAKVASNSSAKASGGGYHGGGGGGGGSVDDGGANADYLKKLQKLAKKIYNANMAGIDKSFTSAGNTLKTNYDSTTGELANKYGYQKGNINSDAEDSMRQAYINSMLQKKDLGQKMAAQGLSGGASETTMASLNNNYSNARNNIDTTRQRSISDLDQTYNSNLAEAQRQYNSAVQNLAMQREKEEQAARNAYLQLAINYAFDPGNITMPTTDYATPMATQNNFTFSPTSANNNVSGVATLQGAGDILSSATTNYAKYLAQQRAAGASLDSVKNDAYTALKNGQISGSELINILDQLGIQV